MSDEVRFLNENIIKIDSRFVKDMEMKAAANVSGKFRYCFHENENAGMQEMIFAVPKSGYARPHMHSKAAESQMVISGAGYCILFDDDGNIRESFKVSMQDNFLYRIRAKIWHMVIPITEQMVIYEVREGKFDANTNVFPEWAPKGDIAEEAENFKQNLLKRIGGIDGCSYHMEGIV